MTTRICRDCDHEIYQNEDGDWVTLLSWSEGGTGEACGAELGDHTPYLLPPFSEAYPDRVEAWQVAMEHIWTVDALTDGPEVWHYYVPRAITTGDPWTIPTLTVEIKALDPRTFSILFGKAAPCMCWPSMWTEPGVYASSVWTINPRCLQHGDARREDDPRSWPSSWSQSGAS